MEMIKKAVNFGLTVGETIYGVSQQSGAFAKAKAALHILEEVPDLFGIDFNQAYAEFKAASPEQLEELKASVAPQFSIPDAEKEAKIEAAILLVIDIAAVVQKAVDLWKPKVEIAEPMVAPAE